MKLRGDASPLDELRASVARLASLVAGDRVKGPLVNGDLGGLAAAFALEPLDLELLLVAAAPDLDGRLAAVLEGRITAGRALELVGSDPWSIDARRRLGPAGPLLRYGLLVVERPELPFPQRPLRVPDRVVGHLLGDDAPDAELVPLISRSVPAELDGADVLARAMESGIWFCWVREQTGAAGAALAASAFARVGALVLSVDLDRHAGGGLSAIAPLALREAAMRGAGLIITGVQANRDRAFLASMGDPPCPVVLIADRPWDPAWSGAVPFTIEAGEAPTSARRAVWEDVLRRLDLEALPADDVAIFRLQPEQIVAAAAGAAAHATAEGRTVTPADLQAGVRAQNAGRLDQLARRIEPKATFETLVVAPDRRAELDTIIQRARTQELVRGRWGMGGGGARRGQGVTCLFAGPSGTGKTLAAEVVAHELAVDLYTIDLSQVVDKYIGETEKNLERIFVEAEGVNGVLFFDEADALFGKRSDVQSSNDRHANVEVAYLLQRMERFDGVAVLATNLRGNLDEAFTRRIDVICQFTDPDEVERERLWRLHLPPTLPVDDDIDVSFLAKAVEVPGGVVRNITLSAAYAAAAEDRIVTMTDLVRATAREYRKLGRLVRPADFGPYADVLEVVRSEEGEESGDG